MTFDYPNQELRIGVGELPLPDELEILQFRLVDGTPYISIQIGPLKVEALVDSGGAGGMTLPLQMAEQLPLKEPVKWRNSARTLFNVFEVYEGKLGARSSANSVISPTETLRGDTGDAG